MRGSTANDRPPAGLTRPFSQSKSAATSISNLEAFCATPTYAYSAFAYTAASNQYAPPLPSPAASKTYSQGFDALYTLLPETVTYTTYSLNPNATGGGKYGEPAYHALWSSIEYSDTVLPISTTISPTLVATSELVFPLGLYTPCPQCSSCLDGYCLPKDFVGGVASSAR